MVRYFGPFFRLMYSYFVLVCSRIPGYGKEAAERAASRGPRPGQSLFTDKNIVLARSYDSIQFGFLGQVSENRAQMLWTK